jgi:hypothetical protein
MPASLITVRLALPEIKPLDGFASYTTLLTGNHPFRSHEPLFFIADDMKKGPDLGNLFSDVPPKHGALTLELGLVLQDVLPDVDDLSECVLNVRDANGVVRVLCLSNRMSRFHFFDADKAWHCLTPRTVAFSGSAQLRRGNGPFVPAGEELLHTVAAMRFEITGSTAEEAFEANIRSSADSFLTCINVALEAARASRTGFRPVGRSVVWETAPPLYALVSNGNVTSRTLIGLHGARAVLRPAPLVDDDAKSFRGHAAGTEVLTDVDRLLGEAISCWESGEYEFAFLQAVIAAEVETSRIVRAECLKRGISKARLDDTRRELTYSWALNIALPLVFDEPARPSQELIAAMNFARQRRNGLMHEAEFSMTRDEVHSLIQHTKDYIEAIRRAASAAPTSTALKPS